MTPIICDSQSVVPRHEWLLCLGMNDPPDVNDSPVMPSLKLCSGVTLCMSLHCWLVEHNHGSYIHYYSLAKSDNLFARLLSTMIHQHPSSYNVRIFWCKCIWCPRLFLSVLEEWCRYRRVVPVPGGVTAPARSPCCVIFDRFGLQGKIVMTVLYILHVPRNDKVRVGILCVET